MALELVVLEQEVLGSSQVQHMSALVVQCKDYSKKNCFIVFRIGYFRIKSLECFENLIFLSLDRNINNTA